MARIRSIKPEFFTSEQVADCSPTARLLFVGMWCFCDDRGVHPASAKRVKMEVFPGDEITEGDIQQMLDELISAGLLIEFTADDKPYWAVTGWHHQKIEKPNYKYPAPPAPEKFGEQSSNGRRMVVEQSATIQPRSGVDIEIDLNTPLPPKGDGFRIRGLSKAELASVQIVLNWFEEHRVGLGLADSFETKQRVLAAAAIALADGKNPPRLFRSILRKLASGDFSSLSDDRLLEAKRRLQAHEQSATIPEVQLALATLKGID